jgi:hypothetical protein
MAVLRKEPTAACTACNLTSQFAIVAMWRIYRVEIKFNFVTRCFQNKKCLSLLIERPSFYFDITVLTVWSCWMNKLFPQNFSLAVTGTESWALG